MSASTVQDVAHLVVMATGDFCFTMDGRRHSFRIGERAFNYIGPASNSPRGLAALASSVCVAAKVSELQLNTAVSS